MLLLLEKLVGYELPGILDNAVDVECPLGLGADRARSNEGVPTINPMELEVFLIAQPWVAKVEYDLWIGRLLVSLLGVHVESLS